MDRHRYIQAAGTDESEILRSTWTAMRLVRIAYGAKWQRIVWRFLEFVCLLLFGCMASVSSAAPLGDRISQYGHTVWRIQDGYFGGSLGDVTQTTDGYVWVGTDSGLFKFDGVRFVRWESPSGEQLPPGRVLALLGAKDGTLWIGTDSGLAQLAKNRCNLLLILNSSRTNFVVPTRIGRALWLAGPARSKSEEFLVRTEV